MKKFSDKYELTNIGFYRFELGENLKNLFKFWKLFTQLFLCHHGHHVDLGYDRSHQGQEFHQSHFSLD